MQFDSTHIVPALFVYSSQNILLLVILAGMAVTAQPPWKAIYLHMFGASTLYGVGSLIANLDIASGNYLAGWSSLGYCGACYWFVWIAFVGLQREASLAQSVQVDSTNPRYWSILAVLVFLAIPIVGLWELYCSAETAENRTVRLLVVLIAAVFLGVIAFLTENFTIQQLSSDVAALGGRLIRAQEEERARVAREIHDDYGQRLAMVAVELEQLDYNGDGDSKESSQQLHELVTLVKKLSSDLYSMSHGLRSTILEKLGLIAGVRAFCREFTEQQDIQVDFAHENVPPGIPADVALCVFRIAQEGLTNVKKHSGARMAEVRLEGVGEKLHLSVSDRGMGFDSNKPLPERGIGIRSMEERVRLLGGQLEVHSRPMEGTRIDAWLIPHRGDAGAEVG